MKKGIDVSEHQTGLDYTTLSKQIDFVILREGYRQTVDKMYMTHVNAFRALRVPIIAVYHFIYALDNQSAKKEAERCIANVKAAGLPPTVMIYADFEYDSVDKARDRGVILGPAECNLFTKTFCETVEAAGYKTGIYTNLDYYYNWYDKALLDKYPLWVAQYTEARPSIKCQLWQYGKRVLPGSNGEELDVDYIMEEKDERTATEKAIDWMEALAKDPSHGYDQIYRWGERGDYDCSSAVITAWQTAGVPVKTHGATYTGNMYNVFLACGFKDVTGKVNLTSGAGLKRGDVLLNSVHHTAMYCGDGKEVEASINENGGARGGKPGDQTGREILIRPYRNYPWNYVLRYAPDEEKGGGCYMFNVDEVKDGSKGASVELLQKLLKGLGYKGANSKVLTLDGEAGTNTIHALKTYQKKAGLVVDGICGPKTWNKILGV